MLPVAGFTGFFDTDTSPFLSQNGNLG